ncbi:VOC family protein [Actinokineospora sp. HUAS TT18]|uniref:VOC family protein n=1 Tax=Actinokineospora sp. HUAS TT18 TaxID=3447451 RepID=UPI003F51C1C2
MSAEAMSLCQVAFSVRDLSRTHGWYRRAFGYLPAGGTDFSGPEISRMQDLPAVDASVWWLVDQQDFFQLELFEYRSPVPRPYAATDLADAGYAMIGVHVSDFDATVLRLRAVGGRSLTPPMGARGSRRVCVRDPDGVLVEIMEDDPRGPSADPRPRPEVPVATRFVTLSVHDLELAREQWGCAFGLVETDPHILHEPAHEALWGLAGARRQTVCLWAGDFLVELVQYEEPLARNRPAGHRISDLGLLNVAMGSRSKAVVSGAWKRLREHCRGVHSHHWDLGESGAVAYATDDQGFSIELLAVDPAWDKQAGFIPQPPDATPGPSMPQAISAHYWT